MPAVRLCEIRCETEGSFNGEGEESAVQELAVRFLARLKHRDETRETLELTNFVSLSLSQQFPWFSDLSRLGDDIHHDVVMHLNDVRDAAVPRDGGTGVADHRILLRYLHEYRTGAQDFGGRLVLHTEGLHQGRRLCIGRLHLHCMYNIVTREYIYVSNSTLYYKIFL